MSFLILRTKKLKSFGEIGASLSHTYRTRKTLNADNELTHLNFHKKSLLDVKESLKSRIPEKVRSNAVLSVEYLITASPDWDGWVKNGGTKEKEDEFFKKSILWLNERHGSENVVGLSIHYDEITPHLIAYIVPIDIHGKLNCRFFLGGKEKLSKMQTSLHERVKSLGLDRGLEGSKSHHKTIKSYYGYVNERVKKMIKVHDIADPDYSDLPSKGFIETNSSYSERVEGYLFDKHRSYKNNVFESIKALEQQNENLKKNFNELNKKYNNLMGKTRPYFLIVDDLPYSIKVKLDDVYLDEYSRHAEKIKEEIKENKEIFEFNKKERKEKLNNHMIPSTSPDLGSLSAFQKKQNEFFINQDMKGFSALVLRKYDYLKSFVSQSFNQDTCLDFIKYDKDTGMSNYIDQKLIDDVIYHSYDKIISRTKHADMLGESIGDPEYVLEMTMTKTRDNDFSR